MSNGKANDALCVLVAFCFDQCIRFPPCPVVHVPVSDPGQAAVQSSSAACSPEATAPHGLCSIDFRFYSQEARPGSTVTIALRCFPVNGDRDQELCQVQIPRQVQGFEATANSRSYAEWKDVRVPCRSVLEITFSFGRIPDTYFVYVGQVSKLFVLARAEAELIRCLSDVSHENWFAKCGPNLNTNPTSNVHVVLPQQFSSDRYNKVMFFDLKEEEWNADDSLIFRKLQPAAASSEFVGALRPGNYRLYLWDNLLQIWIMDGCIVTIPERVVPNGAVLFGHIQETEKQGNAGLSRVMDAQVRILNYDILPLTYTISSHCLSACSSIECANKVPLGHLLKSLFVASCHQGCQNGVDSRHMHPKISSCRFPQTPRPWRRRQASLGVL